MCFSRELICHLVCWSEVLIPFKLLHFLHESEKERSSILRKERLEPENSVEVHGEVGERRNGSFHVRLHGIDVTQNHHLQETDFLPHEACVMDGRSVANLDFRNETSTELKRSILSLVKGEEKNSSLNHF